MQNILQNLPVKLWLESCLNTKEWFNPRIIETDLFLFYNLKKFSDDEMRYAVSESKMFRCNIQRFTQKSTKSLLWSFLRK